MYDFVRRYLVEQGGSYSRQELLAALQADRAMSERLARTKGFTALINNMCHSGDVDLIAGRVLATGRSLRRLGMMPQKRLQGTKGRTAAALG